MFRLRARSTTAVVLVLLAGAGGCAETEVAGRELMRLGPYREVRLQPGEVDGALVPVVAGTDVLTEEEREAIERRLGPVFASEVRTRGGGGTPVDGTARLVGCTVRAGFSLKHTVFEARCRGVIERGGGELVHVEGAAVRRVRTRAMTSDVAEAIQRGERNPALDEDDSEAVLEEAARTCARMLVDPGFHPRPAPPQEDGNEPARVVADADLQRRAALRQLEGAKSPAARAGAAVDLARWGRPEDTAVLAPHLKDENALVRRAVAVALGEIGSPASIPALAAAAVDEDPKVRDAAQAAVQRLCSIYADTPAYADPASSNSSTPGARDAGVTPAEARNASTWRQNEACSKR